MNQNPLIVNSKATMLNNYLRKSTYKNKLLNHIEMFTVPSSLPTPPPPPPTTHTHKFEHGFAAMVAQQYLLPSTNHK